ncbi:MAG: amidohydrolase [Actinobacteria bacterium]|nr:amidohydrolase [Actinomycetota bacterium]
MTEVTLLTGGPIHTVAGSGTGAACEAVLVVDDRIAAVGTREECEAAAPWAPAVLDLAGATLLPGFVDAHTHPLMLGQCASWADLTGAASIDEVVKLLREHGRTLDGGPIRGFGYDHHRLGNDDRHPTADDLDRVSPDRPVEIMHSSGHGYVVNHASLKEAGIDAATGTPAGGRIDRDGTGNPTGVVFDAACDLLTGPGGVKIGNHGPNLHMSETPDTLDRMLDLGQRLIVGAGITSVGDCQVTEREMDSWLRARDNRRLRLRVTMMVLSSHLGHLSALGLSSRLGDDRLHLGGVKLYADGALTGGTAYVPCGCDVNHRGGYLFHDTEELEGLLVAAHELGLQTATHAQGPVPIQMVIDAVAEAQRRQPRRDARHRIEHCGFPSDDQIDAIASAGIIPVPQPTQVHLYVEGALRDYGEIAERMYPSGLFADAGIPVVLSSDTPVTMPDVFTAMWAAVTRRTSSGRVVGPECAIDRVAALRGYTIEGARALRREHLVGSLEPGRLADLVIVDRDPMAVDIDELPDLRVEQAWVGGRPA